MFKRITALAAGAVLTAAMAVLGITAGTAHATTATCLGTQNPVSGPVSCGGLFLPGMDPVPGVQPNTGTLSLTTPPTNYWNAPLSFDLYSTSDSRQDFTVYERCDFTAPGPLNGNHPIAPTSQAPCGTNGTPVLNAASSQPEFVTEITPLGQHIGGAINNIANLCVSWEALPIGPHHKYRFAMVERTCDTYGAVFTAGVANGLGAPPNNTGIAGTVGLSVNPFQTFAAVPGNGGDLIANDALSNNFHNLLYVVDDKGFGYPAGAAILYPENDGRNQVAKFVGCNGAVITTGVTFACP